MRSLSTLFDDSEPDPSTGWDQNRKGNVAEAAVAFHAVRVGIEVFRPLLEHGRYDLVLGVGKQLLRVQCKWAQRIGEVVAVRLVGSRFTPGDGYIRTRYQDGEIDAVGAYCAELDRCYLLPAEIVTNRTMIHLRLADTKNRQKAGLHWAERYELLTVIEALAEPASVAIDPCQHADQGAVTAHNFRDRFGYYMELAGNGAEINVTRYGRPYVRLVPATPSINPP